jgi:hypothetical protein
LDDAVLGAAPERQVADVGAFADGVAGDVMHLGVIPGDRASRCRAATVLGMNVPVVRPRWDARSAGSCGGTVSPKRSMSDRNRRPLCNANHPHPKQ